MQSATRAHVTCESEIPEMKRIETRIIDPDDLSVAAILNFADQSSKYHNYIPFSS